MPIVLGTARGRAAGWIVAAAVLVGSGSVGFAEADTPATEATVTVPLAPVRILDTRTGIGAPAQPLGAGQSLDLQVVGVAGVPVGAVGVLLNITADGATAQTYLTAWPAGEARPEASVLNAVPGQALPNFIEAKLGVGGKLSIYNFAGSVNVIADVAGYQVPVSTVTGLPGGGGSQGPPGAPGPQGVQGQRGVSAWDTIPSGVTVSGSGFGTASPMPIADFAAYMIELPAVPPVQLVGSTVGFSGGLNPSFIDPADIDSDCAAWSGGATPPPPGQLCLRLIGLDQANAVRSTMINGTKAFYISWNPTLATATTSVTVRWAYTAP